MIIKTGVTVYEILLSINMDNNPITGATFDSTMYKDGLLFTEIVPNIILSDENRGVFTASWSANTFGVYQLYVKNNTTSFIFISNPVSVVPDSEFNTTVYVGL